MWVEKTKTGYRLCDRVKIDGKIRRISVPLEKDTAQARRKASAELLERAEELRSPRKEKNLESLMELYLEKKSCKQSSRRAISIGLHTLAKILGEVKLDAGEINRALLESSISPQTINQYLVHFRTFLRWIYQYGYVEDDIAGKVYSLPAKAEKKPSEEKYLEPDELKLVLSQLSGMPYYVTKFLALTGCRIGEAAALTVDDISDRYVSITKTYSPYAGTGAPKTRNSSREIFIQKELRELLTEYKEWRLLYMMSRGIRTDLLFFTTNGNHIDSRMFRYHFERIRCPKHIHPHIFRHTHTALLAEQGMSLEAIARRLGHEDSKITKDVYYHVTQKQKKADEDAIADIRII